MPAGMLAAKDSSLVVKEFVCLLPQWQMHFGMNGEVACGVL